VVSVVTIALTEALAHFDLRFPPSIYEPSSLSILLYTFDFRFLSQFRTNLAVSALLYPPPYSIPSPVISVVAMAVTEVPGTHFTLRFPLRFTVPSSDFRTSPFTLFKTSNACITAVIAEVLAQIFRTILGAWSGTLSTISTTRQREREREYFLVLWVRLVSKREFPCALGTFSVKERECMATSALGAIRTMRQRERARVFPCALGTFSVKERVFPCALGTFSVKECLLVLWCDSYDTAKREREHFLVLWVRLVSKRVFPCTLGTFSVKASVSLYLGYV
jgi:hypothetical protein